MKRMCSMKRSGSIVAMAAAWALLLAAGPSMAALITAGPVNISGDDYYIEFTGGAGYWTPPSGVSTVNVLLVGGGGGGMGYGGGGGGGGFYETTGFGITPGLDVDVEVGAGGAGALRGGASSPYPNNYQASAGGQSVFGSLIAYGGQGGQWVWTSGSAGYGQGGTSGTNNQNAVGGLVADFASNRYGSGSGVGVKGTQNSSSNTAGGAGLQSTLTSLWYAGGGGALLGLGTHGGGNGAGASNTPGFPGTANTGGGGGAGHNRIGGDGGSGVVRVYYTIPEPATIGFVLSALAAVVIRRRRMG